MKTVFIITRYEADERHTDAMNLSRAQSACRYATQDGLAPVCPRLFYDPNWEPGGSDAAMHRDAAAAMLRACDEVRQYGASVDGLMSEELELARELGKPVEVFNSIGIPQADWNSVKFGDDPNYQAACAEAGKLL